MPSLPCLGASTLFIALTHLHTCYVSRCAGNIDVKPLVSSKRTDEEIKILWKFKKYVFAEGIDS
jgi:hypothetical protein